MKDLRFSQIIGLMEVAEDVHELSEGRTKMVVEVHSAGRCSVTISNGDLIRVFVYGYGDGMTRHSTDLCKYYTAVVEFTTDIYLLIAELELTGGNKS